MNSKIIIGLFMVFLMAFAVGCGKDDEDMAPVPAESSEPTPAVPDLSEDQPGEIEDIEAPDLDAEPETEPDVLDEPEIIIDPETTPDELEGITDISEDEPLDEDELTASNYRIISLKDLKAYPSEMEINVGTTVEWRNVNDNFQHIIGWRGQTSMGVKPEPILVGESWSWTFTEPGDIQWFSTAKPTIQGKIKIVTDEASEETSGPEEKVNASEFY